MEDLDSELLSRFSIKRDLLCLNIHFQTGLLYVGDCKMAADGVVPQEEYQPGNTRFSAFCRGRNEKLWQSGPGSAARSWEGRKN